MATMQKQVPTGVKVIAILYYIGALFSLIGGIMALAGASFFEGLGGSEFLALFGGLFVVAGIVMIALAVLAFFIGRGLWKAQKWARTLAIILAILGLIVAIFSIIGGEWGATINLIIQGIIGYYLLFSNAVKQAFA